MTMIPLYRPEGGTIAELLMRRGDVAADAAMRSGQIWGGAVANLGQIAGGAVQQYQQQKEGQKREAAFREVVSTWDPSDPRGFMMRLASVSGPDDAMRFTMGLMAFEESVKKKQQGRIPTMEETKAALVAANTLRKNAPMLFEEQYPNLIGTYGPALEQYFGIKNLPGQPTEDVVRALDALSQEWSGARAETGFTLTPGSKRFGPGGEVIAEVPVTPPKPEKTLPELEAEAAARARGTASVKPPDEKGTWTQAEDQEGNPVLLNTTTGAVKPYPAGVSPKPGATEANRIAASNAALSVSRKVRDYIKANRKVLGALMGRYQSLAAAMGAGNPVATRLIGELMSYSSLQPQIHGFRSAQFVDKIEKIINIKQDPDALIATIEGIDSAAEAVSGRGRSKKAGSSGTRVEMPGGWIEEE